MSNRHGLSIRTADRGDLDGLVELLGSAGLHVTRDRLSAFQGQPGSLLIAAEWGPPSGVIAVHWHAVLTSDLKAAWISFLFVDPERRRNGIARLLLKAASQAARAAGCGDITLSPTGKADELRAFCLATGFAQSGALFSRELRKRV